MRDEWDAENMCDAAGLLNLESASAWKVRQPRPAN